MKLAFLTTHPIQYQAPVFRHLAATKGIDFTTVFCTLPTAEQQGAEFGVRFRWDVPLLSGYRFHVLDNVAKHPGVMSFTGCDTPGIYDYLRSEAFDAVAVNGWVVKSCLQTARACRKLGIPCIVRGEANQLRRRPYWKRVLHRRLMRYFSAYCPIGRSSAQFYRDLGIDDQALFRSPYCVENDRIAASSPKDRASIAAARQQFGLDENSFCFLFCGKLIAKKQPKGFLEAVRRAYERGARFEVLVVGDGELRSDLEHFVKQHRLPVHFAGFLNQSEIGRAYSATDALVLPSDFGETWGLVVNEAFAAGIPALVSDRVGCHPDLIVPGQTGWVHSFGDWDELADQMYFASGDPKLASRMGTLAKQHIQSYSPQSAADGILLAANAVTHDS